MRRLSPRSPPPAGQGAPGVRVPCSTLLRRRQSQDTPACWLTSIHISKGDDSALTPSWRGRTKSERRLRGLRSAHCGRLRRGRSDNRWADLVAHKRHAHSCGPSHGKRPRFEMCINARPAGGGRRRRSATERHYLLPRTFRPEDGVQAPRLDAVSTSDVGLMRRLSPRSPPPAGQGAPGVRVPCSTLLRRRQSQDTPGGCRLKQNTRTPDRMTSRSSCPHENEIPFAAVNPTRLRELAHGLGWIAGTDRSTAGFIGGGR